MPMALHCAHSPNRPYKVPKSPVCHAMRVLQYFYAKEVQHFKPYQYKSSKIKSNPRLSVPMEDLLLVLVFRKRQVYGCACSGNMAMPHSRQGYDFSDLSYAVIRACQDVQRQIGLHCAWKWTANAPWRSP